MNNLSFILFIIYPIYTTASDPSTLNVQDTNSSCGGKIAGGVLGTLAISIALQVAARLIWKIYWKGKKGQHLVLVTDPEKCDSVYAFDNPGFKEGPIILRTEEKESQKLKWTHWNSVGLVPPNNSRVKAMDDSFTAQPSLNIVPLRSHDFTGLGFNICGNMRDGIFVKDVLHRGPASESGCIMPGDRIDSVKISLRNMVLEDALTILSYASPYEVELSIEACSGNTGSLLRTPPPPHRICHPFYRSHSISDLHQIVKMNGKKFGDQPNSLLSDLSGKESSKTSTLDRKPKSVEPERHQNTKNSLIECVQKQECIFQTIELEQEDHYQGKPKEANPLHVKSLFVKGIQNLKEKIQHSLYQDENSSTMEKTERITEPEIDIRIEDGFKSVELSVPQEVEKAGMVARINRKSISGENEIEGLMQGEDEEAGVIGKKRKGKAPMPPQRDENEKEGEREEDECDEGGSTNEGGTMIKLDSYHVTVHQGAESNESRKASSLGDLSRYEAESLNPPLERAVSLDLVDGPGGKKKKAPIPPSSSSSSEPSPTERELSTLKKSSFWHTLQDAMSSDSEIFLGISGCSTPERTSTLNFDPSKDIITSKPQENDNEKNDSFIDVKLCTSQQLNIKKESDSINEEPNPIFKISDTSGNLSHAKTVTFSPSVKYDDNAETEDPIGFKKEEIRILRPSQETVSSCSWDLGSNFVDRINSSDDVPPKLPNSPIPTLDSYITEIEVITESCDSTPIKYMPMVDREDGFLEQLKVYELISKDEIEDSFLNSMETIIPVNKEEEETKMEGDLTLQNFSVFGAKRIEQSPSKTGLTNKGSITFTNFKATPSRIPVRASPRTPPTPTSSLSPSLNKRTLSQRNGLGPS